MLKHIINNARKTHHIHPGYFGINKDRLEGSKLQPHFHYYFTTREEEEEDNHQSTKLADISLHKKGQKPQHKHKKEKNVIENKIENKEAKRVCKKARKRSLVRSFFPFLAASAKHLFFTFPCAFAPLSRSVLSLLEYNSLAVFSLLFLSSSDPFSSPTICCLFICLFLSFRALVSLISKVQFLFFFSHPFNFYFKFPTFSIQISWQILVLWNLQCQSFLGSLDHIVKI